MDNKTEQIFIINTSDAQALMGPQNSTETTQQNVLTTNVCRTCAAATEFLIPIFHGEGLQNNLAEKIHKHLPIQVSEQDELPQTVCYQCASTLLAWHELVECCVQADRALRTRLIVCSTSTQQEDYATACDKSSLPQEAQAGPSTEIDEAQTQPQDLDKEKNQSTEAPPAAISCPYCGRAHGGRRAHTAHLVAAHAELLFHCDECGQYQDRKDLILHMTVHAVQYSRAAPPRPDTGQNKPNKNAEEEETSKQEVTPLNANSLQDDEQTECKIDTAHPPSTGGSLRETSDFSDHTDTDDGFGPLPESVFEAIEDSQDSQPEAATEPKKAKKQTAGATKSKWTRACPYCPKVYTASSSYFYHIRYSHKGIKEHECDVCKRKFATKASVKQHMATHGSALPHGCAQCGKRFRSAASLYIHGQTHGAAKRFVCATCGKAFRWKQLLLRHEQRHAAAREHPCGACGRAFRVRCDMLRHARTHQAQAHACLRCGRQFAQLRYLKVHMDKKHAAEGLAAPEGRG